MNIFDLYQEDYDDTDVSYLAEKKKKKKNEKKSKDDWIIKLCKSSKSNKELGASNLASCKSRGLRAREGSKSHKIGGERVKMGGKRIKGRAHGGPLPDWSDIQNNDPALNG